MSIDIGVMDDSPVAERGDTSISDEAAGLPLPLDCTLLLVARADLRSFFPMMATVTGVAVSCACVRAWQWTVGAEVLCRVLHACVCLCVCVPVCATEAHVPIQLEANAQAYQHGNSLRMVTAVFHHAFACSFACIFFFFFGFGFLGVVNGRVLTKSSQACQVYQNWDCETGGKVVG
eukprot:m.173264 g.173264  ORF g.173264 m.173264 type:complete len:176 (+) comp17867_c1_seq3:1968-2495(+)